MKLTKDTFSESQVGNSLVFFYRETGCANCEKVKPLVEAFVKEGVKVFSVSADEEKELTGKYAPLTQWQLPLIVYFENGKVINKSTGLVDENKIFDITKTIYNISDGEITEIVLSLDVEVATKRKELFMVENNLRRFREEIVRRQTPNAPPVEDFPLPTETATTQPVELCEWCQ